MDFKLSGAEEKFRQEVREFLDKELHEEVVREVDAPESFGPACRAFLKKAGAKGWLAPHWPKEYGGLSGTHMQQFLVLDEINYRRGPGRGVSNSMAGPVILLVGNEEQKKEWLPPIARGEFEFALGYTEPQAGSDLASLDIRAVEDGDDYVLNGQKVFNTACHYADYHWLGARTDPKAPKHRGISLFIVDLKSPGITIREIKTMGDFRTNEVFYDNVRVPKRNLVGIPNRGWYHIATALDFERMIEVGGLRRMVEELVEYTREQSIGSEALIRNPMVRHRLTDRAIEVEVAQLLAYRVAWLVDKGTIPNYESAMLKAYATELSQRIFRTGMELLGLYGQLHKSSKWVQLAGRIERHYRRTVVLTILAGSSEIMRNIIALRGLRLPAA